MTIERRDNLTARMGGIRMIQLIALVLMLWCVAKYDLSTLSGPGYLLVILAGEKIDMDRRAIRMMGNRREDLPTPTPKRGTHERFNAVHRG